MIATAAEYGATYAQSLSRTALTTIRPRELADRSGRGAWCPDYPVKSAWATSMVHWGTRAQLFDALRWG